jgi:hypothetical protein
MQPTPFHQLSDEPLYCEAVHDKEDDGFYSGSEDDHYEGPLHRRLHIEKKAIDFLSGNVPILISAALRGPFDRRQWNNPWRSTRAESHAEPCRAQPPQPIQTVVVAQEGLPDTQGTSLYPLPSPEITNPPSTKKNPYMDEQGYSRIKTWREAVKSTTAFKDPFWQSQQAEKVGNRPARKRSADSKWLHKRDWKRQRSTNPSNPSPDDSPSRGAAQTRGRPALPLHVSEVVAQFLRNSSPPEDELATDGYTRLSRSNISPMANTTLGVTPHRTKRYFQPRDTSDDELSMSATTPTSKAVRSSTMVSGPSTRDRSPSRRRKATKSKSRPSRSRENASRAREKVKKSQGARSSTSHSPYYDETGAGSPAVEQVAEATPECTDVTPLNFLTKQSERFQDQLIGDSTSAATSMVLPPTLAALTSAQQDNSFFFRKTARSPIGRIEGGRSAGAPKARGVFSKSSIQLHAAKTNDQENQCGHGDGLDVPTVPGLEPMTRKKPQVDQHSPTEHPREPENSDIILWVDGGCLPSHNPADQQTQYMDRAKTKIENTMAIESVAEAEVDGTNDFTEVVQFRNTNERQILEEPQSLSKVGHCSQSASQWTTYLDTEERTPASFSGQGTTKKSDSILVMEDGVDGSSDPGWSTFINTQDITPAPLGTKAAVDSEESITNEQVSSDQTTLASTERLPPVSLDAPNMACEATQSAFVGECSLGLAGQTDGACEDSTRGMFPRESLQSQVSVGSIIDAYAEINILSNNSEPNAIGNPGAEHAKTEADAFTYPCSLLNNKNATVSMDGSEVHNECTSTEKSQELQTVLLESNATEPLVDLPCDPSKPDGTLTYLEARNLEDFTGLDLQILGVSEENSTCSSGSSSLNEPTADPKQPQLQSPWGQRGPSPSQMPPEAPSNEINSFSVSLNKPAAEVQSPWNKKADMISPVLAPLMTCTNPAENTPNLSFVAGKALAMSQLPQSPWGLRTPAAPEPPAPDFDMSIRAFSDFMSLSPVKKRASSCATNSGDSSARPGILSKTPAQRKPGRRVHFELLPGEEETCFTEFQPDGNDAIYEEEDISYFDLSGRKAATVRVPKPTRRTASPPPLEMSSMEVGGLPDHDQKFSKHFEAMSKRKPNRKPLRLLPLASQQAATASPEIGAMAEAFLQASQIRKQGLEIAAEKRAETEYRFEHMGKPSVPVEKEVFQDQENMEPVDDVSLVLDNLDKFLDNTWGVDMGTEENPADDVRTNQQERAWSHGAAQKVEYPISALEANIWAE